MPPPSRKTAAPGDAAASDADPRRRAVSREQRRREILEAALAEFAAHGYAQAKLDLVARRAGIAKGTLYLYFADKEALFGALVEETLSPALGDAQVLIAGFEGTTRDLLDALLTLLTARVLEAPTAALIRLMIAEGPRFPALAGFYHREVVSRGLALIRQMAQRGLDRGEISSDAALRFPQLVVAPAVLALVWNGLFSTIEPLDTRALLAAHRDLLLAGLGWRQT